MLCSLFEQGEGDNVVVAIPTFEDISVKVDSTKPIQKQNNYEDVDYFPPIWISDYYCNPHNPVID